MSFYETKGHTAAQGELPAHASGTSLDLKLLSRRNCPSLHLGDPPATVAAAVSSLQHVRLDNERLTGEPAPRTRSDSIVYLGAMPCALSSFRIVACALWLCCLHPKSGTLPTFS